MSEVELLVSTKGKAPSLEGIPLTLVVLFSVQRVLSIVENLSFLAQAVVVLVPAY